MSSTRKEESKQSYKYSTKSSQSKTSAKHFSFSEYKRKKEIFLSLFSLQDEGIRRRRADARRERESGINREPTVTLCCLLGTRLSRPGTYYLTQERTSIRRSNHRSFIYASISSTMIIKIRCVLPTAAAARQETPTLAAAIT